MALSNTQCFFEDNNYIELIRAMSVTHENCEWEKRDECDTLKLLMDKSASLGKWTEKSSKLDKSHHSNNLDQKKKPFEKKLNYKSADTSSYMDKKSHTSFVVSLKGITGNF
jgi:hypothetical protein